MSRPLIGSSREIPDEILEMEFRNSTPPVLYKYRNWIDKYHIDTLTKPQIWFSNPKQLNDLYDIRLAYAFNSAEVHTPEFFSKLRRQFPNMTDTIPGTKEFEYALASHYESIKGNPQKWFYDNQASVRKSDAYDVIGLFSTTTNPLEHRMWAYYGDSHKGFCIGYDPYLLWKAKRSMFGKAHYISKPINYSFIENNPENFIDLFIKAEEWAFEKEYRLVTFVDNEEERLVVLDTSVVKEVVLGSQISPKAEEEIVKCLKNTYSSRVLLYKVEADNIPELKLKQVLY